MQITDSIHALDIPFKIPVGGGKTTDRSVNVFLVLAEEIALIDAGVSGSETQVFDYITSNGRNPKAISMLILSHSHPDHIGAAKAIHGETGCTILAHSGDRDWIEDTSKQFRERPVPGFDFLVQGPVRIARFLEDGEAISFGKGLAAQVIHTPGHSKGSISLLFSDEQKTLFSGDAVLLENDLPMYDDITASVDSIRRLSHLENVELLLSSWDAPIRGKEKIMKKLEESVRYLQRIHETVLEVHGKTGEKDIMKLCQNVVSELKLPPFAANPIAAKAFASSLEHKNLKFELY